MRKMQLTSLRPRFRLRTLLLLTAILATACYWWVARPSILAYRFAAAVNRGDYQSADQMFAQPDAHYLAPLETLRQHPSEVWSAKVRQRTWYDLLSGRRIIAVYYTNGQFRRESDFVRTTPDNTVQVVDNSDDLYSYYSYRPASRFSQKIFPSSQ